MAVADHESKKGPARRSSRPTPMLVEAPPLRRFGCKVSMHESTCQREKWKMPHLKTLDLVRLALEGDRRSQTQKYNGNMQPNSFSSRFHVPMPQGPQHRKYCWRSESRSESRSEVRSESYVDSSRESPRDSRSPSPSSPRPAGQVQGGGNFRYDRWTVIKWFAEIDRDGDGRATKREVFLFLRQHPEILMLTWNISSDFRSGPAGGKRYNSIRQDNYRISDMIKLIDKENKGWMDCKEFEEMFRHCGVLLEYAHTLPPEFDVALPSVPSVSSSSRDSSRSVSFDDICARPSTHNPLEGHGYIMDG